MRNFITVIFVALATMFASSCTSCNNDAKFGVEYNLAVDGTTDGAVDVMFVDGHFDIDGAAKFDFDWTNVKDSVLFESTNVYNLEKSLTSIDTRVAKTATLVDEWINSEINVTDFTGHYDLYIKGYVKETLTGLKFEVDKRITNWPDPNTSME